MIFKAIFILKQTFPVEIAHNSIYVWWNICSYIVQYLRGIHAWLSWLCVVVLTILMYPWSAITTINSRSCSYVVPSSSKGSLLSLKFISVQSPIVRTRIWYVRATKVIIEILLALNRNANFKVGNSNFNREISNFFVWICFL